MVPFATWMLRLICNKVRTLEAVSAVIALALSVR
jgi:hypothetical protein